MNNMQNRYHDIIHLSHHVSKKHRPMPLQSRAAQFSPFAALTGYDEAVEEIARRTDSRYALTEEQMDKLNQTLQLLYDMQREKPLIRVTYFVPDQRKSGGAYREFTGHLRFLDAAKRLLRFTDGTAIPWMEITDISIRRK